MSKVRHLSEEEFAALVDSELGSLFSQHGFRTQYEPRAHGNYAVYFFRDQSAVVISKDFDDPHLECDIVPLPRGGDDEQTRLGSEYSVMNWTPANVALGIVCDDEVPPKIGLWPTATDFSKGLRYWRHVWTSHGTDFLMGNMSAAALLGLE